MGLFKRGTRINLDRLSEEEIRELTALPGIDGPLTDALGRYPESWPVNWTAVLYFLEEGDVTAAYHCATTCMRMRPDNPRSKMALSMVHQVLSMAATADGSATRERWMRAQGYSGPIDDPGADTKQVIDTLGLDIDTMLADHRRLLEELLRLNVDRETRRVLERAQNLNRLARDWRSGELHRRMRWDHPK